METTLILLWHMIKYVLQHQWLMLEYFFDIVVLMINSGLAKYIIMMLLMAYIAYIYTYNVLLRIAAETKGAELKAIGERMYAAQLENGVQIMENTAAQEEKIRLIKEKNALYKCVLELDYTEGQRMCRLLDDFKRKHNITAAEIMSGEFKDRLTEIADYNDYLQYKQFVQNGSN